MCGGGEGVEGVRVGGWMHMYWRASENTRMPKCLHAGENEHTCICVFVYNLHVCVCVRVGGVRVCVHVVGGGGLGVWVDALLANQDVQAKFHARESSLAVRGSHFPYISPACREWAQSLWTVATSQWAVIFVAAFFGNRCSVWLFSP